MPDWIRCHEVALWWIAALSTIGFIAALILVPLLIVRIPSDYFSPQRRREAALSDQHPLVRALFKTLMNLLGCILILAGILMLILPGQGILTILMGVMLMHFPGKDRLELWIVSRKAVIGTINWLRKRAGQAPLILEGNNKVE